MARSRRPSISRQDWAALKREIEQLGPEARVRAAERAGLAKLGRGQNRTAFLAEVEGVGPRVLKIDRSMVADSDGADQMECEIICMQRNQGHPLVPKIYDFGPDLRSATWSEVEHLEAGPTLEEKTADPSSAYRFSAPFEASTGIPRPDFEEVIYGWDPAFVRPTSDWQSPVVIEELRPEWMDVATDKAKAKRFIDGLEGLISRCRFDAMDLATTQNWGIDASGQAKLLDFGFCDLDIVREMNPRRRKKTPEYKRLIDKCHKLWETYDAKPLKKNLVAFGKHIERMKQSESAKVKTEARRAMRAFNSEFKARGWKR